MSIDARVKHVLRDDDGYGELHLEDRPPKRLGDQPGIAGQKVLFFLGSPDNVGALQGLCIWGGASTIFLGDEEIADRLNYTEIKFYDDEIFNKAVEEYHKKHL